MVKRFLHLLPPGAGIKEREKLEQWPPEFQVDELFDVPGVGTVVGGKPHLEAVLHCVIIHHVTCLFTGYLSFYVLVYLIRFHQM